MRPAINVLALGIYIETLRKLAPSASTEKITLEALRWHDICVAQGWIASGGIGDGGIASAA